MRLQSVWLILASVFLCACASSTGTAWMELHELQEELERYEADRIASEEFALFQTGLQEMNRDVTRAAGMLHLPFNTESITPEDPLLRDYKIQWQLNNGRELLRKVQSIRSDLEEERHQTLARIRVGLEEVAASSNHPELGPLLIQTAIALGRTESFLEPGHYDRALARLRHLETRYSALRSRWLRYNGRRMSRDDFTREESEFHERMGSLQPKGVYIVIDTALNRLYLKEGDRVILDAPVSTGSYRTLISSERRWTFETPRGEFSIQRIIDNPIWRKPDWAFLEEGKPVPRQESKRFEKGALGQYALWFGGQYYIHGTPYTRLLGENVTHGCIRVGPEDLARLAEKVSIGTKVYIF